MTCKPFLLLAVFLTSCALIPVAKAAECETLGPCISLGNIAVMAEPDIADPILKTAQDGAAAFTRYFDVGNAPIAIVPGGKISPALAEGLKAAGYANTLPWISAADKQALAASNIRRQVMEQTQGMSAAQQEAILKMAMAKAGGNAEISEDMSTTEQGALTHELGHMWFIAAFTPTGAVGGGGHGYGGWAPDWLDETAAVLLENETLIQSRRKAFKAMSAENFYPLDSFLAMGHPALKSVQALNKKLGKKVSKGGSRAIVLSGKDAEEFLKASGDSDPAKFYTQVRGFADFIIEATGDEQAFAKLARYLSNGESFESWLADTPKLPSNLKALTESWNVHLASR